MPARCEQCGEEALTGTARFCVGCGATLPAREPAEVLAELAEPAERAKPAPPPEPPPALRQPQPDTPPPPPPLRMAPTHPVRSPHEPLLRDMPPAVPMSVVVAGVIGLLTLLLILVLVA